MKVQRGYFFVWLTILIWTGSLLQAQTPTGSVSGTVSDTSSALVAGATVRIINNSTHETHSATTGASGTYIFPIVPVGEYSLEAESAGFKTEKRTGITLDVNQNARVDFALQIGAVKEVVEVNSDSPMVDTMDVQLGETVDQKRIENLPLMGRNIYDLISLMPGAVNATTGVVTGTNINNSMNVNGNRGGANNFYIDGGNNTSQFRNGGNMAPNPDAIAEFHLITSNFDAEYGRNPGSVLNVVTRSGANAYHGTVFEFLRNDTVDARSFFQTSTTPLHWNQFGGTFGGPIRHNKTFFFASYQGLREATSTAKTGVIVPTVPERTGNFSALAAAKQPTDPLTGKTFPGGIIPTSRIDPVAQAVMNTMVPLPNSGAGAFSDLEAAPATDDQGMLRIDHQLTASNRISGTLFLDRSNTSLPFGAGNTALPNWDNANAVYRQNNVIINDSAVISPTLISEARFNYTLNYYATVDSSTKSWPDWGSKLTSGDLPWNPPEFVVTGFWTSGPTGSANDVMPQSTWAATERVTWIHGKHNIRAGVGYQWNHFMETGNWLGAGQVHFTGAYTGNGLADLELGLAATFRQNNGLDRNFQQSSYSAFFQDDWKVLPRLTLDLGVRWELNPPYTAAGNTIAGFEFGVQSKIYPTAPLGMVFPGDPGVPDGIGPTIATNFAPRLGFAYDVFGNGKTAIRGGYGFYYAVGWVNQISNLQNQPFIVDITINGTQNLVDPWASVGVKSPYPYTLSPKNPDFVSPISENYIGDHSGTPYVQQYNFMIQQQIGRTMSLEAGFVGNTGRKLYILRDANAPIYGPTANTTNVNTRRPYLPNVFGAIYESETAANSNYNSLQVKFNRRFSHNFSLMANYVWSKSLDLADAEATSISSVTTSDSNDFRRDYGPAAFNYPQVFNMSWVYQSPRVGWFGWLGKEALSGWQLNGIMQSRSGHSMNVLSGTDSNDDGIAEDRPNVVGSPNITTSQTRAQEIAEFFNPAAFAKLPATGVPFGNAGRNVLLGPNAVTWNATATKDFPLPGREGMRLQLRAEFFNLFNQVNFSDPNVTLSSTGFGKITGSAAARMLQFGLKLYF